MDKGMLLTIVVPHHLGPCDRYVLQCAIVAPSHLVACHTIVNPTLVSGSVRFLPFNDMMFRVLVP